jgi:hypothetical protein
MEPYSDLALFRPSLSAESKDVVKLGIALIATMAALVLSLLLHSAKSSFDARNRELVQTAADIVLLDRLLAHYGPEAKPARESLRAAVETARLGDSRNQRAADDLKRPSPGRAATTGLRRNRLFGRRRSS